MEEEGIGTHSLVDDVEVEEIELVGLSLDKTLWFTGTAGDFETPEVEKVSTFDLVHRLHFTRTKNIENN